MPWSTLQTKACWVVAVSMVPFIEPLGPAYSKNAEGLVDVRPAKQRLQAATTFRPRGPIYDGGGYREAELLASCYRKSLQLAVDAGLRSVAFPCISTGVFGYPIHDACDIAVSTVVEWLAINPLPELVTFCCFSDEDADIYRARLA